jgi:hypothetical protein
MERESGQDYINPGMIPIRGSLPAMPPPSPVHVVRAADFHSMRG